MTESRGPAVVSTDDPEALASAAMALRAGGIVGLPTETVYGLAVLPQPTALQALLRAKQRSEEKGIALLIDDLRQVDGLVAVSDTARRLAGSLWPGALTLVLPLRETGALPDVLTGGRGTLAVRLPDHETPRSLARILGPIAASSANRSGESAATTAAELVETVGESLALVLDDGPVRGGTASSVVSVDAAGGLTMLREGAISRTELEDAARVGR